MEQETMKQIGRAMSVRMGILMSFALALIGTATSGHFTVPGFLISFVISTLISLIIGFLVPVGRVSAVACQKAGLARGSLPARALESLISDLIYTPVMTLMMVALAYFAAMRAGAGKAQLAFLPMFLRSLVITFIAGYILIFIFMPILMKSVMKKFDLQEQNR